MADEDNTLLLDNHPLEAAENEFIVGYKAGITDAERNDHEAAINMIARQKSGFKGVGATWNTGTFKGYHVHIDAADLGSIRDSNLVAYVEDNGTFTACEDEAMINEDPSTWGLGRISHRRKGYHNYYYNETAGEMVNIYVLDTGIRVTHNEFKDGRARWGANFVPDSPDEDEKGHGTHCAGTAIGVTYGVAKRANAVAVKVLNKHGSGRLSWVLAGINWAYDDAGNERDQAVISMSLGGRYSQALNDAVLAATSGGMTVSVAAGNKNDDVAHHSPASAPTAITVAAINSEDYRAKFSNWGAGVDVFAPGVRIKSAWIGSDTATRTISGTSMACPHVSGLAAYYIRLFDLHGPAVKECIIDTSTQGQVIDPHGSPNRIAYNSSDAERVGL